MGLPQHSTDPSPALVIRTSVLQTSQRNLLPNRFGISVKTPFCFYVRSNVALGLFFHRLFAADQLAGTGSGDNKLSAALGAAISFPHLISHICTTFRIAIVRVIIILLCWVVNFSEAP